MKNGTCWLDDQGNPIQAHGGQIIRFGDTWYWYGENKDADNCIVNGVNICRVDVVGVSCYSSKDLHTWHYEGLALKANHDDPRHPLHHSGVLERPKVLFCEKTGKYVMWFHLDDSTYAKAHAGCAVADSPTGPFTFLHSLRPGVHECRDMTLYQSPEDGHTYLVHAGDMNHTMYFTQLTDDLTRCTGVSYGLLRDQGREAPALCYNHEEKIHYCITSGCTGWNPNASLLALAERLSNDMRMIDNPFEGPGYRTTFDGQPTWIFEADGRHYIMLDHWKPLDLRHSGYSILPLTFGKRNLTVTWQDEF